MATALVRGPGMSNSLTISNAIATPGSTVSGTDPYLALVMQCKEEAKNKKTAYIRKVYLCTRTDSDSIYRRTVGLHGAFLYNWP